MTTRERVGTTWRKSCGVGVLIRRGGGLISVDQMVRPLVGTHVSGISRDCRKLPKRAICEGVGVHPDLDRASHIAHTSAIGFVVGDGGGGVGGSRVLESSTPPGVPPLPRRTLCRRCERTQTATSGITAFSVGATHPGETVEMRSVVPMKMITAPAMRVRMGRRGLLRVGPDALRGPP